MDNTILNLTRLHFKQKIIAKIMGIGVTTVREHWAKMKERKLVPEEYLFLKKSHMEPPIIPSKTSQIP